MLLLDRYNIKMKKATIFLWNILYPCSIYCQQVEVASINYDFRPLMTRCMTVPCTSLKQRRTAFSQASDYEDYRYFKNSNMQYDIEDRLHNTQQSLHALSGLSQQHGLAAFSEIGKSCSQQISEQLEILFQNDCGFATLFKT